MSVIQKIPYIDYTTHPAYGKFFGHPAWSDKFNALKRFLPHFWMIARVAWKFNKNRPLIELPEELKSNDKLYALSKNGVTALSFSPSVVELLKILLASYIEELEKRKAELPQNVSLFKDKVVSIQRGRHNGKEVYEFVEKIMENEGVLDLASRYRRGDVRVRHINLMINHPWDTDWKNHFSDIDLPDPKTAYMHMDSSVRRLRCLIYLTDVREKNGPFCYCLGSNRYRIGFLEFASRKANDVSFLDKCDPVNRRLFLALPKIFQKKCEFGNDFLDSAPEAHALLKSERCFTSEDGNAFLFDSDGVHRGGMVEEGVRRMLQVNLEIIK